MQNLRCTKNGYLQMKKSLLLILFILVFQSCSKSNKVENVEHAFYYWKSDNWRLSENEKKIIDSQNVSKLYVKFFEVEHNDLMGNIPVSKNNLSIYSKENYSIIPCVYIRNEVFLKSKKEELDILADNIIFLINKKKEEHLRDVEEINEIQMDCDWTLKSKENYFYFLTKLKQIYKKKISCTLRLYPYKYPEKMGIPPVDKATLMCYNLINPLEDKSKNSILDTNELSKYLNKNRKYPLHLDIALPVYSWMQLFQNNEFTKVIYTDFEKIKPILKPVKPLWFEVTKDITIADVYLRIGDKIKYDEITAKEIKKAIEIIKKNVNFDKQTTISLFHLDEEQLKQYSNEEISSFYSLFTE